MPQNMLTPICDLERRLNGIRADLGISEHQDPAWQAFVKTYGAVAIALESFDEEAAGCCREHLPSFPNALDLEIRSLAARLAAVRMVKAITHSLYPVLSSRQRERADRLLPALSGVIVGQGRSAHIRTDGQRRPGAMYEFSSGRTAKVAA